MFGWLKKEGPPQHFADNKAAFAHACTIGYPLLLNAHIPALVLEEGRRGREGEHCYRLLLAAQNGSVEIWGCTMADAPALPEVGEFVAFRIVRIASELPEDASIIGYIASRLDTVLMGRKGWRIAESFAPDNLKPEIRF